MAENDIYDNKKKYEYFKQNLELFALEPSHRPNNITTQILWLYLIPCRI